MNNDPWGSIQNFTKQFQELASNPKQYAMNKMGIPEDIADNPDAIIQNLMSKGRVNQQQYNAARQAAMRIQNNPIFAKLFYR